MHKNPLFSIIILAINAACAGQRALSRKGCFSGVPHSPQFFQKNECTAGHPRPILHPSDDGFSRIVKGRSQKWSNFMKKQYKRPFSRMQSSSFLQIYTLICSIFIFIILPCHKMSIEGTKCFQRKMDETNIYSDSSKIQLRTKASFHFAEKWYNRYKEDKNHATQCSRKATSGSL